MTVNEIIQLGVILVSVAGILYFFLIHLPNKNKRLQIAQQDMVALIDKEEAQEQCEEFHRSVWRESTIEEMFKTETRHCDFNYYCPVCDRYRE